MRVRSVLVFLAFVVLGAPIARADMAADAEKLIGLLEKLAKTVEAAKGNCDKMAKNITKFVDANSAAMKELGAKLDKLTPEEKETLKKNYGERINAVQARIANAAVACKDHPKAQEAFKKLIAK